MPTRVKKLSAKDVFLKYVAKKREGMCRAAFCKNDHAVSRDYCWKCEKHWWRSKNVRIDRYNNLRSNAKRRKITFGLTFEEFNLICDLTGYTSDGHVQFGDRLSLDRIKREDGYVLSNLRVISVRENCRRFTNTRILVGGVWLESYCVDFGDDPLNEIRLQAVQDKIAKYDTKTEGSEGHQQELIDLDDDDEPAWLRPRSDDPF